MASFTIAVNLIAVHGKTELKLHQTICHSLLWQLQSQIYLKTSFQIGGMEVIYVWRMMKKGSFIVVLCWLWCISGLDFLSVLYLKALEREDISVMHWQYVQLVTEHW